MEHPKEVGDRSTLAVMLALQQAGYDLYIPFGENTRCDLVIESKAGLDRIQCKTGRLRNGAVVFPVCSTYGHHRLAQAARRDYRGEIDFFAVYCPETTDVYLVPVEELPMRTTAALRITPPRNGQRRGVRFAEDYKLRV